ncbi:MAG: hypothetical protein MPJ24_06440 [Pirellulaceae bacterium]|nr:hypothetical protein [Pirellulaceae bacterium]
MKKQDKNTRYYLDVDLDHRTILGWGYDQKENLVVQSGGRLVLKKSTNPTHHRIFLSKGQYNKLTSQVETL